MIPYRIEQIVYSSKAAACGLDPANIYIFPTAPMCYSMFYAADETNPGQRIVHVAASDFTEPASIFDICAKLIDKWLVTYA